MLELHINNEYAVGYLLVVHTHPTKNFTKKKFNNMFDMY